MANEKEKYVAPKVVTIEELLGLVVEPQQMDYTDDAWSYGTPPQAGIYNFKLYLDKDGIVSGLEDQNNPKSVYVNVKLICKITDEGDNKDIPVYTAVSTKIYRGKGISTMAGLLAKLVGPEQLAKIPNPISPVRLADLFLKLLKKEPVVKGELDWKGSYKWVDKDGKDQWENVIKHATGFPFDPENKSLRLNIVEVNNSHAGGKVEVNAQTFISRFYGKNEEVMVKKIINTGTNPIARVPDLVLDDEPKPTVVTGVQHPVTVNAPTTDDDLLMLA